MKTDTHVYLILLLLGAALQLSAQEWTRFRGPNGTGVSQAKTIPTKWTEKDINWRIALPGVGHSSPVLWGDRIFLTSAEEVPDKIRVFCLKPGDGSVLWKREFPLHPHEKHKFNSFASATPSRATATASLASPGSKTGMPVCRPRVFNCETAAGREFHFVRSISIILPLPYLAHDLREFVEVLRNVSLRSLYFHIFESRLRLGRGLNDFSAWIEEDLDEPELADSIAHLDPYNYTLEGLRSSLIQQIEKHIK